MQVISTCQVCGKQNLYIGEYENAVGNKVCLNCYFQHTAIGGVYVKIGGFRLSLHTPTETELKNAEKRDALVKELRHQFNVRYNLFESDERRVKAYGENPGNRYQCNIGDIADGAQDPASLALRTQARIDKQVIIDLENIKYWPIFDIEEAEK